MHDHHWSSAEIVSSPNHLPRAAVIATTFDTRIPPLAFNWRTHASAWPAEYGIVARTVLYSAEAWRSFHLRILGFPNSRFLPHR